MGNQHTTIKNETTADFYVMSFSDADVICSYYYQFKRCPAGERISIECLPGDAIKIGIIFYIDDGNLITGNHKGDYDFWRVKNHKELVVSYIGDKKGVGLKNSTDGITYWASYSYEFYPADTKAIAGTMDGIRRFAACSPDYIVNK
ncbi:unnamed protein product [Oikopleura dioica]|uniref:Uncharacterized protein n=1 Tax=Oikopleura dioica TaxID=34765 RepID=E4WSS3_OIKDI|nr:unnamed protein product [Oikopleura dioica]